MRVDIPFLASIWASEDVLVLFFVYKLFDFALDGIGIDIGRFGEELRAGYIYMLSLLKRDGEGS